MTESSNVSTQHLDRLLTFKSFVSPLSNFSSQHDRFSFAGRATQWEWETIRNKPQITFDIISLQSMKFITSVSYILSLIFKLVYKAAKHAGGWGRVEQSWCFQLLKVFLTRKCWSTTSKMKVMHFQIDACSPRKHVNKYPPKNIRFYQKLTEKLKTNYFKALATSLYYISGLNTTYRLY